MTNRTPKRSVTALAAAGAALVPLLLVLAARPGRGQDPPAAGQRSRIGREWTVESHDRTNFPLVGKHRTLSCRECHVDLVFEGTPTDCEYCHWIRRQDDRYSLRLGTRCSDCHTPQSWKKVDPALWSHAVNVGFPLVGAHRTLDCEACHGSAGFSARPTDCYSCHAADYQRATEPNHVQSGFSHDCTICHGPAPTSWAAGAFDHPFPIRSGRHAGFACTDCHPTSDFRVFNCLGCHEQAQTTSRHDEVPGFSYSSPACYACHPQGTAGD